MPVYKKPYLQPYKGKSTRHTCPACKDTYSFTLYLDGNTGQPIHSTVGKCNHENKCGYHYTPRQYFNDHPGKKNNPHQKPTASPQSKKHQTQQPKKQLTSKPPTLQQPKKQQPPKSCQLPSRQLTPLQYHPIQHPIHHPMQPARSTPDKKPSSEITHIPYIYLKKSASYNSNFVRFLCNFFSKEKIEKAVEDYALGATKNNEVIFWQIDIDGKIRTGKIMQYNPKTGKRVKNKTGAINWVHNKLNPNSA